MDLKSMSTEQLLILLKRAEINRDSRNKNISLISQELQSRPMDELMWTQPKADTTTVEDILDENKLPTAE